MITPVGISYDSKDFLSAKKSFLIAVESVVSEPIKPSALGFVTSLMIRKKSRGAGVAVTSLNRCSAGTSALACRFWSFVALGDANLISSQPSARPMAAMMLNIITITNSTHHKSWKLVNTSETVISPMVASTVVINTGRYTRRANSTARRRIAWIEGFIHVYTSFTKKWYHLPDVLRVEYYQAIIQISKELRIAKEYLGNGLPALNAA